MERNILHIDCNCFFASVEMLKKPEYAAVPMAVGGSRDTRHGIILAKNERAKAYGIKTGETLGDAFRKCPALVIAPPCYRDYERVSRAVNEIYAEYTDRVEPFGIDESYLDVTSSLRLFAPSAAALGDLIRERIKREIGVTVSVGVSFCKTFAKMGSDMKKPDATTVINREDVASKVWPLPVSDMIFVGRKTTEALSHHGITTVGGLAAADPVWMKRFFGVNGVKLIEAAKGNDGEDVGMAGVSPTPKSVGNGMTFPRDLFTSDDIEAASDILSENVTARMKKEGLIGRVVSVVLKYPDFVTVGRRSSLPAPTDSFFEISKEARRLVFSLLEEGRGLRALTVCCSSVSLRPGDFFQQSFFDNEKREKTESLEKTLFAVRERYGADAVMTAAMLRGRQNGIGRPKIK